MGALSAIRPKSRLLLVLLLVLTYQADSKPDILQHRATGGLSGAIEDIETDVLGKASAPVLEFGAGLGLRYPTPQETGQNRGNESSQTKLPKILKSFGRYNTHKKRKKQAPQTRGKMGKRNIENTPTGEPFQKQGFAGPVQGSRAARSFKNIKECVPDFLAEVNSPYSEKGEWFKFSIQNCHFGLLHWAKIESADIVNKHSGEACTKVDSPYKEVTGMPCAKCQDQELLIEIEYKLNGVKKKERIGLVDKGGQRKEACSISSTPWTAIILTLLVLAGLILGLLITWATGNLQTVLDSVVSRWNATKQYFCLLLNRAGGEGEAGSGLGGADGGEAGSGEREEESGGAGRAGAAGAGKVGAGGTGASAGGRPRNQRRRFCAML